MSISLFVTSSSETGQNQRLLKQQLRPMLVITQIWKAGDTRSDIFTAVACQDKLSYGM